MGRLFVGQHYRGRAARMPAQRKRLVLTMLLVGLLAACATHRPRPSSEAGHRIPPIAIVDVAADDPTRANNVLFRAIGLVGTPYKWGGNTIASGFDCSGLVNFVFRDMGNPSPATQRARHRCVADSESTQQPPGAGRPAVLWRPFGRSRRYLCRPGSLRTRTQQRRPGAHGRDQRVLLARALSRCAARAALIRRASSKPMKMLTLCLLLVVATSASADDKPIVLLKLNWTQERLKGGPDSIDKPSMVWSGETPPSVTSSCGTLTGALANAMPRAVWRARPSCFVISHTPG